MRFYRKMTGEPIAHSVSSVISVNQLFWCSLQVQRTSKVRQDPCIAPPPGARICRPPLDLPVREHKL